MRSILVFLAFTTLLAACAEKRASQPSAVTPGQASGVREAISRGQAPGPQDDISNLADLHECTYAFLSDLADHKYKTGELEVPENWDQPQTSKKIRVFYYVREPRKGASPQVLAPVVFFNGGPSSSSHHSPMSLLDFLNTDKRTFVFIDQRGTGCSTAYPKKFDEATARRLVNWGSRGIVRDAEAVREKLFGKSSRWRIFGQSYGALIVHRYLEMAPDGVERAIAHGFAATDSVEFIAERLLAQQEATTRYLKSYPDDKMRLQFIRSQIAADECWHTAAAEICGPEVLDAGAFMIGWIDGNSWKSLHNWLEMISPDGKSLVRQELNKFVETIVLSELSGSHMGADVISKMETIPGFTDAQVCGAAHNSLRAKGIQVESFMFDECRILAAVKAKSYEALKLVDADPIGLATIAQNLRNRRSLEFYLYSSGRDTLTPPKMFEREVKFLNGLVKYSLLPKSDHGGYATEPVIQSKVLD